MWIALIEAFSAPTRLALSMGRWSRLLFVSSFIVFLLLDAVEAKATTETGRQALTGSRETMRDQVPTSPFFQVGIEVEYEALRPANHLTDTHNHELLLEEVKKQFGGGRIRSSPWEKYMNAVGTTQSQMKDEQGRIWTVVPEKMNGEAFDGLELVTPPLGSRADLIKFARVIDSIRSSGLFRRGASSSTHFTFDVSHLLGGPVLKGEPKWEYMRDRNISRFVDLVLFLEMNMDAIFGVLQPKRYGQTVNTHIVPLAVNQKELLKQLAELPDDKRTFEQVRNVFQSFDSYEKMLVKKPAVHAWKFRAVNYGKLLGLGPFAGEDRLPVIEIRVSDLIEHGERLEAVARFMMQLIEYGQRQSSQSFRDPFPTVRDFYEDREMNAELERILRETGSEAARLLLARLEARSSFESGSVALKGRPMGFRAGGRCQDLFQPSAI